MKKRILSMLIMSVFLLSSTGCNNNDEPVDTADSNAITTAYAETEKEVYEMTTTATKTTAAETTTEVTTTETEQPKDFGIDKCTPFSDGIAIISTENGRKYAIDSDGNTVFEFSSMFDNKYLPYEGFCNGYMVYDCRGFSFDNDNDAYYLLDNKGEIITYSGGDNPDFDGVIKLNYSDVAGRYSYIKNGYCLVYKLEKKFSGDVFSLGVIKNGEWLIPLRSDYKMAELFSNKKPSSLRYLGESVICYEGYCYDFVADEIIAENIYGPILYKNGFISVSPSSGYNYIYNTKTKTKKEYDSFEKSFAINDTLVCMEYSNGVSIRDYNIIYDAEGNELVNTNEYGLRIFSSNETLYKDGYIIVIGYNNNNDSYMAVFNEDYELAFEPIYLEHSSEIYFENGIITIIDDLYSNTIAQYNTKGELINKLTGDIGLISYSPRENLFFLRKDSDTYPEYVYINMDGEIIIK